MEGAFRDSRYGNAIAAFNRGEWYRCHDLLEALWHEAIEPEATFLQGLLQLAVAMLHQQRGNRRGATILLGEALGRLSHYREDSYGGVDMTALKHSVEGWLLECQQGGDGCAMALPVLRPCKGC
ncbi:MAG: DUF309 domain-containing protein [Aphanocapsa feldmannii 277cV]|uniref:DUF309 domain-containing protein n=2 Tax=Aphanocapsa feldmannii TaxID=192050 RepID=A0A524RL70_9CHRO|nr:MAG: DUF309 domain-containing protein [Aphanocapsa feldmannii 277cV]TGH19489.1 MAG: DUF309 domain-containing protein [Aphanocapsa feldmannii 277cI]